MCDIIELNNFIDISFFEKKSEVVNDGILIIKEKLNDGNFQTEIISLLKEYFKNNIDYLQKIGKNLKCDTILEIDIKNIENNLKNIDESNYKDIIFKNKDTHIGFIRTDIYNIKDKKYVLDNYVYFAIFKLLINNEFISKQNLKTLYTFHNIDIDNFDDYNLIKVDKNIVIKQNPICIYDKTLNIYVKLKYLSDVFLSLLLKFIDEKYINKLFLSHDFTYISKKQTLLEEIEFGKYFSFDNLNKILPSKLIDYNKNDILEIRIKGNSIEFEERLDNIVIEEDSIITQVIHLEYICENNLYFITHLDHEFIYYTLDEYDLKQNDIHQKGNAKKRMKTFKIDESKIPFILEEGDFTLYLVLNEYFHNKDLLKEYFQEVLKN